MEIDYPLWTLLGTWFSGIAMIISVIASLYLATRSKKIKIKLTYALSTLLLFNNKTEPFFSVSVSNIGERSVTIADVGIKLQNKKKLSFLPSIRYNKLPAVIEPESSLDLLVPCDTIAYLGYEKLIDNLDSKFTLYVRSSVGDYYLIKTKETGNEIIENAIKLIDLTNRTMGTLEPMAL